MEGGRCRTAEDGIERIIIIIDGDRARGLGTAGGGGGAVPSFKGPRARGGIRFACRLARLQRVARVHAAGIAVRHRGGAGGGGGAAVRAHVEVDLIRGRNDHVPLMVQAAVGRLHRAGRLLVGGVGGAHGEGIALGSAGGGKRRGAGHGAALAPGGRRSRPDHVILVVYVSVEALRFVGAAGGVQGNIDRIGGVAVRVIRRGDLGSCRSASSTEINGSGFKRGTAAAGCGIRAKAERTQIIGAFISVRSGVQHIQIYTRCNCLGFVEHTVVFTNIDTDVHTGGPIGGGPGADLRVLGIRIRPGRRNAAAGDGALRAVAVLVFAVERHGTAAVLTVVTAVGIGTDKLDLEGVRGAGSVRARREARKIERHYGEAHQHSQKHTQRFFAVVFHNLSSCFMGRV